nr:MAG TPA: hypothetical protein [Caudoviricetes sp.]
MFFVLLYSITSLSTMFAFPKNNHLSPIYYHNRH